MTEETMMSGAKRRASELSNATDTDMDSTTNNAINENSGKSTVDTTGATEDPTGPYQRLPVHGEHKRAVSCLAFAPTIRKSRNVYDSQDIVCASASADGSVRLWDITAQVHDHEDQNRERGEEEDGDRDVEMISQGDGDGDKDGDLEGTIQRNSRKLNPVAMISGHTRGINDLAWSPRTPSLIATASDDKTLRIWDVNRSLSASQDTNQADQGVGAANTIGSPSVGTGANAEEANHITEALVEFKGHTNFCFSTKFSPQGNLLVSGSFDETVKIWDVRTGECVSTLPAHSDPVTGVDFNTDGTCIVSSSHDGLMRIWDVATGECLKTIYAEGNPPVTFVKYSPNGKYILSGMLDGRLRLWDVMNGLGSHAASGNRGSSNLIPDDNNPSANNKPILKDYLSIGLTCAQGRGGQCTKTYSGHLNLKYCIFSAFSVANRERQSIVTGSEDGKVHVYDLQTRKPRQVIDAHDDACLAVAVHDRKEIFASGGMSKDRYVKFWVPTRAH